MRLHHKHQEIVMPVANKKGKSLKGLDLNLNLRITANVELI
jgi:hypothetical protein